MLIDSNIKRVLFFDIAVNIETINPAIIMHTDIRKSFVIKNIVDDNPNIIIFIMKNMLTGMFSIFSVLLNILSHSHIINIPHIMNKPDANGFPSRNAMTVIAIITIEDIILVFKSDLIN